VEQHAPLLDQQLGAAARVLLPPELEIREAHHQLEIAPLTVEPTRLRERAARRRVALAVSSAFGRGRERRQSVRVIRFRVEELQGFLHVGLHVGATFGKGGEGPQILAKRPTTVQEAQYYGGD